MRKHAEVPRFWRTVRLAAGRVLTSTTGHAGRVGQCGRLTDNGYVKVERVEGEGALLRLRGDQRPGQLGRVVRLSGDGQFTGGDNGGTDPARGGGDQRVPKRADGDELLTRRRGRSDFRFEADSDPDPGPRGQLHADADEARGWRAADPARPGRDLAPGGSGGAGAGAGLLCRAAVRDGGRRET